MASFILSYLPRFGHSHKEPKQSNVNSQTNLQSVQSSLIETQSGNQDILFQTNSFPEKNSQQKTHTSDQDVSQFYTRHNDGLIEMTDKELLKKQKQVLGSLIRQFGSNLFKGKSIMNTSLPVTIFEGRSVLERSASSFCWALNYLKPAAMDNSPMNQMKMIIGFLIATLSNGVIPLKPFNPILGETFQGMIDECPIYFEQVMHNPPTSAFLFLGHGFQVSGLTEYVTSISMNSVTNKKLGIYKIYFANTGSQIFVQFPETSMHGTSIGKRTIEYTKHLSLYDKQHKIFAQIDFSRHSGNKKHPKDSFVGGIFKVKNEYVDQFNEDFCQYFLGEFNSIISNQCFEDGGIPIEGFWMDKLLIGGKLIWHSSYKPIVKMSYVSNPLPSDCNFRPDIRHLREGQEEEAQRSKIRIEEIQRRDRKLRGGQAQF